MDLSAQEVNLSVPELFRRYHRRRTARNPKYRMDLYSISAVVMLLVWAGVTFTVGAPGWMNLLLTAGADVNRPMLLGGTGPMSPLALALNLDEPESMRALLAAGANSREKDTGKSKTRHDNLAVGITLQDV